MIKRIAVLNYSTVLTTADIQKMVAACNLQVSRDVAPAWGKSVIPVTYYTKESAVPVNSAKIFIFNNSDQQGALGYHTISGNQPWGTVFAKTIIDYGCPILFDSRRKNEITVSAVLSHEVIELIVNPFITLWADGPEIAEGSEYAFEACDPVEANMYQITPTGQGTISVSNFVYPEYFNKYANAGTKMDYLGLIKRPFTMTDNGYMIVRSAPNNETAIYGSHYPELLRNMK